MTAKQIHTRVISDQEYWDLFLRFNKAAAKNIINHAFLITPETQNDLDKIILWCENNTTGLIYITVENGNIHQFGLGPPIGRFYLENKDDATLFKLTWGG